MTGHGEKLSHDQPSYVIRFGCEWGAGCLWPENDAAYEAFDLGPYDLRESCPLPLSQATLQRCRDLDMWHRQSLNLDSTVQPGPWRQAECDRFNTAVIELVVSLQNELGPEFEVINRQGLLAEDPDLDEYLANPNTFRRQGFV